MPPYQIWISITKIRRCHDRLIFIVGIPIHANTLLVLKRGPGIVSIFQYNISIFLASLWMRKSWDLTLSFQTPTSVQELINPQRRNGLVYNTAGYNYLSLSLVFASGTILLNNYYDLYLYITRTCNSWTVAVALCGNTEWWHLLTFYLSSGINILIPKSYVSNYTRLHTYIYTRTTEMS